MYVCTLGRYYDRVYFRFRHLEFEPSGSARSRSTQSHELQKWRHCGNNEVLQKFQKSFGCIYTETAFKDIQNV